MANVASGTVARQLESLFEGGCVAGLSDRLLLERFTERDEPADEAAFAAMVARHGPMVLSVCRQLLGDHHRAEDAFQAVFLVLARRARSIRDPDLLGTWLYGVALRTARKARGRTSRWRRIDEEYAARLSTADPTIAADQALVEREQVEALHREIARLPQAFRVPVVLCYFEGLTLDEAAHRLRWPAGTVRSRLARARLKLRRGLTRRGFALPTAVLVAGLSPRSASATISVTLCDATTRSALRFAVAQTAAQATPAAAINLAQQVLRSMLLRKAQLAVLTLLFVGAIVAGAGYTCHSLKAPGRSWERELPRARQHNPARTEPRPSVVADDQTSPDKNAQKPASGRMIVIGRVLDPTGKPVANATTMVYAALKQPGRDNPPDLMTPPVIGQTQSDGSGRFRLDATRTSSLIHEQACAVAIAPGYGVGWVDLDLDADQPVADITLRAEYTIRGRLFDLHGRPVQGVSVSVRAMGRVFRDPEGVPDDEGVEGPEFRGGDHAKSPPAWPRPAVTDAEGRFTMRGAGRGIRVVLAIDDPRFARQIVNVDTENVADAKPVTLALEPARIVAGRITYADTGKPVPRAKLVVFRARDGGGDFLETDDDGRYRANPGPSDSFIVRVLAPQGQPYLITQTDYFAWPKGAVEHRIDVVLPKGIMIRGKVTEEGSGKPIAGTMLGYRCGLNQAAPSDPWYGNAWAGPDGAFQLAVSPKSTHLIVQGPSEDFVLQEIGQRMLEEGRPGGLRMYAHAFIPYDLKSGGDSRELNVVLRRGTTVKGQVVGPDGQPIQDAKMVSRVILMPSGVPWRSWQGDYTGQVRNGRFELHGLGPNVEVPVFFHEPKRKLGALVNLSGKSGAGGPITVRLQSCGAARARLVNSAGKPLAEYRDPYLVTMVVSLGPAWYSRDKADEGQLAGEKDFFCRIDPINYTDGPVADAQGRVIFPALIPGATYQILDVSNEGVRPIRKEFTVKPGETVDLGDIRIEKPEA
jgi:RNA polymerase sigma factor (sigma-70 family)